MRVIKSVIRSAISKAVREAIAAAQRYFMTFDPVLNSYAELDTAFQPSGDFEIEAVVSTTATTGTLTILSGSAQSNNAVIVDVQSTGTVRFFAYVGGSLQTIITSTSTVNDGQLHIITATYTGTTAELFIGGASEGTATWALDGNQDIKYAGQRVGAGNYFDGYIADVKLTDLTTAANSRIFPLAVGAGTTENSTINSGSITINNIPDANRELFTFDEANNQWVANDGSPTIGVA